MNSTTLHFEKHQRVTDADKAAVDHLMQMSGLSKHKVKQAMQKGAAWIGEGSATKRIRRASKLVRQGEQLHFYYDEQVLNTIPPEPELVADEGSYSVWNKPYGLRSQGSKWGDHCTINRWVEQHLQPQRPAFVVHRLDRAATGLIIIAHTKKMAAAFSRLFRERNVFKQYQVLVHGHFPQDKDGVRLNSPIDGKQAVSLVCLVSYDKMSDTSLVNVTIETGRKHQIRRHLADAGFPVTGDRLYGKKNDDADLALRSYRLEFECPETGQSKCYRLSGHLHRPKPERSVSDKANPDQYQNGKENSRPDST